MRTLTSLYALAFILGGTAFSQDAKEDDAKYRITASRVKEEILIPKDLDAALKELDHMLTPQLREEMRKGKLDDMSEYHFGLGMWMRNNWGLWKGSALSKWFNQQGIYHPDDMSGVILTSYWRHLNAQPIDLEGQVKYYQDYWKKAAEETKQEKRRVVAASQKIRGMMLGLKVVRAKIPTVTIRQKLDGSFRVRYAAPFQGGLLLTAKTFIPGDVNRKIDFTVRTAFLNLKTGTLQPVKVSEGDKVEDAIVVGRACFLNCLRPNGRRILQVEGGSRTFIAMPPFPLRRLGVEYGKNGRAQALLAVGARKVARWNGKSWTRIWEGKLELPVCALPAQRFGDRIFFRDEGRHESDKRLFCLSLPNGTAPIPFDEDIGVVGSHGPRWEDVTDYAVKPDGTYWLAAGSDGSSLLRKHPAKGYQVAVFHASTRWSDDILGDDKKFAATRSPFLYLTGLELQPDGSLDGIGEDGLVNVQEGKISLRLRFAKINGPFDNWEPTTLLTLSPTQKFIGASFGGMFLLEQSRPGKPRARPIGPETRTAKVF